LLDDHEVAGEAALVVCNRCLDEDFPSRDRSACVTLQRVPKPAGQEAELEDHWLKFYHIADEDKEFPLRNRQVSENAMASIISVVICNTATTPSILKPTAYVN